MKERFGLALALIIALFGGWYLLSYRTAVAPGGAGTGAAATYYCANSRTIGAVYATSSVALTLSDGRSLALPQTRSGSGARYEATTTGTDVVFWNKGDNAFLSENGKNTYDECTAAVITPSDAPGYALYTDPGRTFSFAFPTDFTVGGSAVGLGPGWSAPATTSGMVLAKILVPKSFEPGTNFGDAWFTVGASSDPSAVATCRNTLAGPASSSTPVTFGGMSFTKLEFTGVGAGNIYDTTSYRTVKGGECYAIEYTIHYGNILNYPTGAVKEFDEARVTAALDEVARSFAFLGSK